MNNKYIICILAICALNVISPLDARGFHAGAGRAFGGHVNIGHVGGGGHGFGKAFAGGFAGSLIGSSLGGSNSGTTVVAPTTNVIFASPPVHSIFD